MAVSREEEEEVDEGCVPGGPPEARTPATAWYAAMASAEDPVGASRLCGERKG
jgi:hypothetical protein